MPGEYAYLDESDLYVTSYWGRLSLLDILETISRRLRDPDLQDARVHAIDLSNAVWTDVPPKLVHEEVDRLRPAFAPPRVPTILIAPGEFFYGFARMYAVFQVAYGAAKVDVARTWSEASSLTGVDLKPAEQWSNAHASAGPGDDPTRSLPPAG